MFFFFKQKTAYEMRISDWSSDVCSADLRSSRQHGRPRRGHRRHRRRRHLPAVREHVPQVQHQGRGDPGWVCDLLELWVFEVRVIRKFDWRPALAQSGRSEEHTSELQSLRRISYAVVCLKKKKTEHARHRSTSTNNKSN